ncbi:MULTISPECIES: nuclear transport factor 2 family protein [Paraburkholderia]|uniref:Nuclear transport factor 2 family protein n=1 Tax=Paraburkholderia madseniana TaxID=2599607 RepID=A0AAP5BKU5_9BURK|nr:MULTISPECIES: nuclear transport factor 2 family protein [Paraburkholderia]MCX4149994.1 nuclear transport factor 2 family protein [Paraburkholderia madseniana]MDN7152930.1 nuclear transport factor 2 family protein [Paraburkholderia sp. WS6]MDQ6411812.1 nuclear transport factor 2 family protein [Paraburkholderia madseniana]
MTTEEIVGRFFAAREEGDVSAVEQLLADDVTIWHNFTGRVQTKQENIDTFVMLNELGSFKYMVLERHVTGDSLAQRYEAEVVMKSGEVLNIPVAIFMTVRDGQVVRIHEYLDSTHVVPGAADVSSNSATT